MAPDPGTGAMRKIPEDVAHRARARRSRASVTAAGGRRSSGALSAGSFDASCRRARRARDAASRRPGSPTCRPSTIGDALAALAAAASPRELGIPCLELVVRREPRPPQREMANAAQQVANVRGAFTVTRTPPPGTGLLLDDRRHSGWTLAMVGGQLRMRRREPGRTGRARHDRLIRGSLPIARAHRRAARIPHLHRHGLNTSGSPR